MELSADEENVLRVVQARYCDHLRRGAGQCGQDAAMVLALAERCAGLPCWDFTRQVGFGHAAWMLVHFGMPVSRAGGLTWDSLAHLMGALSVPS